MHSSYFPRKKLIGLTLISLVSSSHLYAATGDLSKAPDTVLSHDDIVRSHARTLADLLRLQAGIYSEHTPGQPGNTISVRNSGHGSVRILLDGNEIKNDSTGSTMLSNLPLSMIGEIRIYRSSGSAGYGSDGNSGVIEISTLTTPETGFHGSAGTEAGSDYLLNSYIRGSYVSGSLSLSAYGSQADSGAYNISPGDDYPDRDRKTDRNAYISSNYRITPDLQLDSAIFLSDARAGTDIFGSNSSADPVTTSSSRAFNSRLIFRLNENVRLQSGISIDRAENSYAESADDLLLASDTGRYFLQSEVQIDERNTLTSGAAAYYTDFGRSSVDLPDSRRSGYAYYGHIESRMTDWFTLNLKGRFDSGNIWRDRASGQLQLTFQPWQNTAISADIASNFRNPTAAEEYYSGTDNLKTETSLHYELGISQTQAMFNWSAAVYREDLKNTIQWQESSQNNWQTSTVSKAYVQGAELQAGVKLSNTTVNAGAAFQRAINRDTGSPLENSTDEQLYAGVSHTLDKLTVNGTLSWYSSPHSEDESLLRNALIAGLSASYDVSDNFDLYVAADNLFNRKVISHQFSWDSGSGSSGNSYYINQGRVVRIGADYRF